MEFLLILLTFNIPIFPIVFNLILALTRSIHLCLSNGRVGELNAMNEDYHKGRWERWVNRSTKDPHFSSNQYMSLAYCF